MAGKRVTTGGNGGKQVAPKRKPKPKPKPKPKKKPKPQKTMIATGGRGGQRKRKGTG